MKRIVVNTACLLLAVLIGACAFCAWTRLNSPQANSEYQYALEPYGAIITGYDGDAQALVIPETLAGYPVVAIADSAFSATIFRRRDHLKTVVFPDGVHRIGDLAFAWCDNLQSVVLPKDIEQIGESSFAYCNSLQAVWLPDQPVSIGSGAFQNCIGLRYISIPRSVTSIGAGAFGMANSAVIAVMRDNENYAMVDGSLYDTARHALHTYGGKWDTRAVVPEGTLTIEPYAFAGCKNLAEVVLPESLTTIGTGAFTGCPLKAIHIPANVVQIEEAAFGQSGLEKMTIAEGNAAYAAVDGALYDNRQHALHTHFGKSEGGEFVVRKGTTRIMEAAFSMSKIKRIRLPDSLQTIGDRAFYFCEKLEWIQSPPKLTAIGDAAFHGCENLTEFDFPDSLTKIGMNAFTGCRNLADVALPKGVTEIAQSAFSSCTRLKTVTLAEGTEKINADAFAMCFALERLTLPASVTEIAPTAFYHVEGLRLAGPKGSYAERYTKESGIPFDIIGGA